MGLYCVFRWYFDYDSDPVLVGVFSTKKLAENKVEADKVAFPLANNWDIEEFELDK